MGFIAFVVAPHRERDLDERRLVEVEAGKPADPLTVGPAAMPGVE